MDKTKGTRSMQAASKCLQTESKKSITQDVSVGKQWSRGGRRREPAAGTFPSKSEVQTRKQPRAYDKRPRARGGYAPKNCASAEEESTARIIADVCEPELGSVFRAGSKKQSLNHLLNFHFKSRDVDRTQSVAGKLTATAKHNYNKEHYIQAKYVSKTSCQFIVNSNGDYRQYLNNPDALVDWGLIEQINLQVNETPSCPICLYPPMAAKMTRCGHIYCWSCILHYLALSERSWSKCPICYESIHDQDLKSVVTVSHPSYNVNEVVTFKLMRRSRGSLVVYPVNEKMTLESDNQQLYHASDARTLNVHSKLLLADENDISAIIERERSELERQFNEQIDTSEQCFIDSARSLLNARKNKVLEHPSIQDGTTMENDGKSYYFYQAADGQHLYMHSVNVQMLEHTYGSLEQSPTVISGRIVEKEGGSMTEELRNRLRCLQHLPVTCQFEVAEISLNSSMISKETAEEFAEQLDIRRKRRQKRARDEKRREKRIVDEENRQMGKIPLANIQLDSQVQFPEFGASQQISSESSSLSESSPLSFAKMLGSKPQAIRQKIQSKDECVSSPTYNCNFSDAIAMALEKASLEATNESEPSTSTLKKKKKNKQKLLFATSMTYSS